VRRKLLNTNISYSLLDECASQDDFLLMNPLHWHLFSQLTHHLRLASLLVGMDNRRTRRVNMAFGWLFRCTVFHNATTTRQVGQNMAVCQEWLLSSQGYNRFMGML
jgi:hypothetical protein